MAGFTLIKIFCDTNILHASQAHLLLSSKVHEYISEHQRIESVDLKWMVPKMVIDERRHQMIVAAKNIKPKIDDLEKLLGHNLGINDQILEDRIDSKIQNSIQNLGIEVVDIDHNKMDWKALVNQSAKRLPPFEISGEKEKGFRDAIIAHTFIQEHETSPSTPRSCLLVFVSGDKVIKSYIEEKTQNAKNIRILESLDDLKSLLNAIASEVTEEFLSEIYTKASKAFYDFEKKDGIYMKDNVYKRITEEFKGQFIELTENFPKSKRKQKNISLGDMTFIKKDGQTITWQSEVIIRHEITQPASASEMMKKMATVDSMNIQAPDFAQKVVSEAETVFLTEWQHQITTTGKISRAKVKNITHESTEWFDPEHE